MYLLIHEDATGSVFEGELSDDDLDSIEVGLLDAYRFQNGKFERAVVDAELVESDADAEGEETVYTLTWEAV